MENLTTQLENIKIKDINEVLKIEISEELPSMTNYQKCLIPKLLMSSLKLTPGDVIIVISNKTKHLVKVFENVVQRNRLEIYGIVKCFLDKPMKKDACVIEKIESLIKINSVVVSLVCANSYISFWLTEKLNCLPILQKIMKNLLLCANSVINVDIFPDTMTKGLKKIILRTDHNGIGYVTQKTKINIQHIITESQYQRDNLSHGNFFGSKRILNDMLNMIDLNIAHLKMKNKLFPPIKQVLIAGPSGSGKSSLVQMLSVTKRCPLVRIVGHETHCKDPGKSEKILREMVNQAFLYATSEGMCILLLEDVEIICPRGKNLAPHAARLCSQLMLLLDKCQEKEGIIVIATTNKPANVHAGLRRHGRLAKEIVLGKPSENERAEIISGYLNIFSGISSEEIMKISKCIANITPGYLGADLKLLCQTACSKLSKIQVTQDKVSDTINVMKEVLLEMKPASLRNEVEVLSSGASIQLGGLTDVRKQLELSVHCSLLQPHIYARMGIQKPRGILLYGPPGCAKTSLAKSLASKGDITVLYATNASVYSPYVGDAEKAIVSLFHNARQNAPAIIFIDEIDSLVGSRSNGSGSSDVQERVLAALLTQMDGIGIDKDVADENEQWTNGDGVMVIAATNRPNEIDPALLRPGRFDRHIYVPPPDIESRLDILKLISKNTPLHQDVDLATVAEKTRYYSGADLKNLHKETVLYAMTTGGIDVSEIRQSHYEDVLRVMKPSLSEEVLHMFGNIF